MGGTESLLDRLMKKFRKILKRREENVPSEGIDSETLWFIHGALNES